MKKLFLTILAGTILMIGASVDASIVKPSYCKVAISGKDPLILKLDQYPLPMLAKYTVKEFNYKGLIISEVVFIKYHPQEVTN